MDAVEQRLARVEEKLEAVGGRVDDLVDDFHPGDAIEYPQDYVAEGSAEEWALSIEELVDLEGANPEALRQAMRLRLDQDVTQVWYSHIGSAEFNGRDPFELANMGMWTWGRGREALERAIAASKKFRESRASFYEVGGRRSEWALWKSFLKGSEEYLVEDSEGEFEEEEVRAEMKPGTGTVGVPELDDLDYDEGEAPDSADA